jgi:hypothetical protein
MAYTIPYAGGWQNFPDTSTPITAATLNAISDELASYNTAWTSYTPALTASSVNPTLGTGSSATGQYNQIGRVVVMRFRIVFGTSGVSAGTGTYRVSFPVNARSISNAIPMAMFRITDSSASNSATGWMRYGATDYFEMVYTAAAPVGAATLVSATAPWAWDTSDSINGVMVYEAAS